MKDGGTAFPVSSDVAWDEQHGSASAGMTLRDYFAAKAMQGLCASLITKDGAQAFRKMGAVDVSRQIAFNAYEFADAMLAEREKRYGRS